MDDDVIWTRLNECVDFNGVCWYLLTIFNWLGMSKIEEKLANYRARRVQENVVIKCSLTLHFGGLVKYTHHLKSSYYAVYCMPINYYSATLDEICLRELGRYDNECPVIRNFSWWRVLLPQSHYCTRVKKQLTHIVIVARLFTLCQHYSGLN